MEEYKLNHTKAIVTISTIEGYHPGKKVKGLKFNSFCRLIQGIEEGHFADSSVSWLITPGKAVYKEKYGSPHGGEDVFVLEADYTEYDKGTDIHDWKHNIFIHAEYFKKFFNQETVRVTFINGVETTVLR